MLRYNIDSQIIGKVTKVKQTKVPVCCPFSFLDNFSIISYHKAKPQISGSQRQFKLNILYQTISNTTKKICTFHVQIIEANSEIIARAEIIFLKFQHNFLRVTFVFQVLVLFQSNLSHLNFQLSANANYLSRFLFHQHYIYFSFYIPHCHSIYAFYSLLKHSVCLKTA